MYNNKFESNKKYFTISIYTLVVILVGSIIIRSVFMWTKTWAAMHLILGVLFPFLLGAFVALILYPFAKSLNRNFFKKICKIKNARLCKTLSIITCYLLLFGLLGFTLGVIIPQVWSSILDLTAIIPGWYDKILKLLIDLEQRFPNLDFEFINAEITKLGETLLTADRIQTMASNIIPIVLNTSMSVVGGILDFFIALMVSLYLLVDMEWFLKSIHHLLLAFFSESHSDKIVGILKDCAGIFNRYVTGKMVDSLIIGLLCFLLMSILRLPYPLIISLIVGITNMIPYFGPYVGCIPGALIILMISPIKMLIYLIMILVLQQFDGLVLGPKILGDSTGLRPVWIIFAVSIGGSIGGVLGMFLGVPIVAIISYLVGLWIEYRIAAKKKRTT